MKGLRSEELSATEFDIVDSSGHPTKNSHISSLIPLEVETGITCSPEQAR